MKAPWKIALLFLAGTLATEARVYQERIKPQWSADGSWFWYRNELAGGTRAFILVDAEQGRRAPAFDHDQLAKALEQAGAGSFEAKKLPVDQLGYNREQQTVSFRIKGRFYTWAQADQRLEAVEAPKKVLPLDKAKPESSPKPAAWKVSRKASPDRTWEAFIQDHNLWIRKTEGGEKIQLSSDGVETNRYEAPYWAADSKHLLAFRVQPDEIGLVHLVETAPKEGGRAKLKSRKYAQPGDKFRTYELNWFDIEKREQRKPEVGLIDFRGPRLRWTPDGRYARYEKIDRGHQRFRVIEIDAFTGAHRNLIDEQSETFIWTDHALNLGVPVVNWLKQSQEIIYLSEQHGWRQLYRVDIASGEMKRITQGEFVIRKVDRIDEAARQIWFQASGLNKDQDPYLMHHYRVNFDGSGFTALTAGNGWHEITYSPDRKYLIDRYSRVDLPPVHELRRVADGSLVCALEQADISELLAEGWEAPTVFSAKGRNGKTDIWGIIARPKDFDPKKTYPVLEDIYAGPHDSFVPKRWSAGRRWARWTDQGFVVAKVDGMGTANRSKAFHDVCWHNLKDAGFPDRIAWHKAFAKENPWYDLSRVGIYGGSAGGQSSTGALLFHPEFYHVAVSSCGCHDNRLDKASWNEQWMGYPVGPHYAESSNIDNAHRLRGQLMLIVGELDTNVPPESTMRLADALIKAGKEFELVVIPGGGHGDGGRYGDRKRTDFFRKHLLGLPKPDYNQR